MGKIVIVGIGALGSHVAMLLRNEKEGLKVVDFDRVDRKNVLSQFHGKSSVGKNKTMSLAQSMNFLFGVKVESVPHKLTADNGEAILKDAELVIDCVDNIETRLLLSELANQMNFPLLHGALAADGGFGQVVWDEKFKPDAGGEGEATCEDGEHLPFISVTASYIARAAQAFLSDSKKLGFLVTPGGAQAI